MSPTKDHAGYALLQGGVSRWLWRFYTQRLTPAGRWFVLATAIFVAYGGASLYLQGYVLAGYTGALWVFAFAGMWVYRPRVELVAHLSGRACAGESIPVDIEVQQLGRMRGADLIVLPHRLPAAVDSVPEDGVALPDLPRGQRTRVQIKLRCNHRGAYVLRGFRVETGFPFGLLRAKQTFAEQRSLLVYPKFTALGSLELPIGRRYQPGGIALVSNVGESFEYLGNREYRDGDNVRDIDWRATARVSGQRPIVREWVEEYMLRVAVILDTHVPAKLKRNALQARRDAFERAVSVTAAVTDYMARQDYLVDLFAAGPNLYHLTAGRSLAYLDQILDILACVDENPDEPFDTIEPQIAELLARISTVICVMLDWDEPRRAFAHRLQEQGAAVKVIVLRDAPCTLDPAVDAGVFGTIPVISRSEYERGIDAL
jgi:uncharacterized protein (DUF58 family)